MKRIPELLAPAGNEECINAAVSAGADAVYFGLSAGFNARVRAQNISLEHLPSVMDKLHGYGVKGYVTLNTLVFDAELQRAADCIAGIAAAGADAIIVQDLAVARLCREICPELHVHASTQMTVGSPDAAKVAENLGITRVVVPRELSSDEIKRFAEQTSLELECFVHGALCMSFSGQCLASEAWGGRSANRGLCAQSCRLPYGLIVDGREETPKGGPYVLSTRDLAAWDRVADLCAAGVACFKIEGRLKDAGYVAGAVELYRKAIDAAVEGRASAVTPSAREALALTFSRGFSTGFLDGVRHQELVHAEHPGHRGLKVGVVESVRPPRVVVRRHPQAPELKAGDWVVFDQGDPEGEPPRGGVFAVDPAGRDGLDLKFGTPGPDLRQVKPGDVLWKSHDPAVERRLRLVASQVRKVPVDLEVQGRVGTPLLVRARDALGRSAEARSDIPLQEARSQPLTVDVLRDKLGSLGDTPFQLRGFQVDLVGALALPPSEMKRLKRGLSAALSSQPLPRIQRNVRKVGARSMLDVVDGPNGPAEPIIVPMCRSMEHLQAALDAGFQEVELDFMDFRGLTAAVEHCRAARVSAVVATPRIQKPGEEDLNHKLHTLKPDGILARHLGALVQFADTPRLLADFSLNIANALTARVLLRDWKVRILTPAHDLNVDQLADLIRNVPAGRLEIPVHHHLPLFHNQHCLYARHLSRGQDHRDCGRPCERHDLRVKDRLGMVHPVVVDVGCRNTVFHAQAQNALPSLRVWVRQGVGRFRVELLTEDRATAVQLLRLHQDVLRGKRDARQAARDLGTLSPGGLTAGTLQVLPEEAPPRPGG